MPTVTAKATRIHVNPDYACLALTTGDAVLLWSYFAQPDNATNRLTHGTYLAIARDALVHGKTLTVVFASASGLLTSISIDS